MVIERLPDDRALQVDSSPVTVFRQSSRKTSGEIRDGLACFERSSARSPDAFDIADFVIIKLTARRS
jgi:hypothetical protein